MARLEQVRMREALAGLPVLEREVYVLSAVEGLDHAVIAERLGIGTDEVEVLLAAAIVRLDRLL